MEWSLAEKPNHTFKTNNCYAIEILLLDWQYHVVFGRLEIYDFGCGRSFED